MKAFQVDVRRGNSASKHMESCSKSLVIREMYIKTTMRDHLKSTRKALVKKKKKDNNEFWQGCGETETLTSGKNIKWYNHFGI